MKNKIEINDINNYKSIIRNFTKNIYNNQLFIMFLIILSIKSILFTSLIQSPGASAITAETCRISLLKFVPLCGFSLLLMSIALMFNNRKQVYAMLIIDCLFTLLLISDLWYFRGFSSYINFFLLDQLANADDLGGAVIALFRMVDILFIIDIIIVFFLLNKIKEINKNKKRSIKSFLFVSCLCSICLTFYYMDFNIEDKTIPVFAQSTLEDIHMPEDRMVSLGPIGYHIYDGYNYLENKRVYKFTNEEITQIQEFYKDKMESLPDNKYKSMYKGKNLLLIQVESLENFVLGQKIEGVEITPNLNKLLNYSLYFNNFYEQVWNGNSSDCDLLVNGSVYPVREGSTFFRYPNNFYPHSLPNVMESVGYNSFVIHPDTEMYWNYKPALTSLGFNNLYFKENLNVTEKIGLGISDEEYFKQAFEIIKKQKQPFYGMTVTITSHTPFELPKKYQYLPLEENLNASEIGKYFQAVHYTDKQIGMFMTKLEKEGILDNTVVAIYGDHTGVHKYFEDKIKTMENKEQWWVDNYNKIPLIIYNKSTQPEVINIHGGPVDLVPTLGYLMGVEDKVYSSALGRNLLNTKKDFVILSDFRVRGNITKEEEEKYKNLLLLSDKIIRGNYFKNK